MTRIYDPLIKAAADKYLPYDWRLYRAQIYKESSFIPGAVSPAGAQGLAQIMPSTWADEAGRAGYADASPFDPEASLFVGASYMASLLEYWSWPRPEMDRICLALASYNAGKGNMQNAQTRAGSPSLYADVIKALPAITGQRSKETIEYVQRILAHYVSEVTG